MAYYESVVRPLQWCVMDIQNAGMFVDRERLAAYQSLAQTQLETARTEWSILLGKKFNPNSSAQVLDLFEQEFRIPLRDKHDKRTADVLALLKTTINHPTLPIVEGILDYREIVKDLGTYLQPDLWPDNRVRTSFRLYGTLTWRLSSREPNLQNIPREARHGIYIKNIYAAPPGRALGEVDYSALEDRIPAYASSCHKLIQMFSNNEDTHTHRARVIYGCQDISKKQRNFSKRLRYSRGYGAAVLTVCEKLLEDSHEWHPPEEIGPMLKKLDADMPEILEWHNWCWAESERTGISIDGFGIPRVLFEPPGQRRQVAYSDPTQRTASGIMNRSMVRYYDAKQRGHFRDDTFLVCQVHDSLMMEAHEDHIESELRKLIDLMQVPVDIFGQRQVLFPCEAKWGKSWGDMKKL